MQFITEDAIAIPQPGAAGRPSSAVVRQSHRFYVALAAAALEYRQADAGRKGHHAVLVE
jgi:hypothetical protein